MVTVRESNKIVNDVKGFISGMSPDKNPNVRWFKTSSPNIKPGMGVIRVADATGDYTITEHGAESKMTFGIAEFDPKQIANNGIAYASGDLIPVLPLHLNLGLEMRNIQLTDPNAAILVDTPLAALASGMWGVAVEAVLEAETGTGGEVFVDDATIGKQGTTGATIWNRNYLRTLYHKADADNPVLIEAYIVAC